MEIQRSKLEPKGAGLTLNALKFEKTKKKKIQTRRPDRSKEDNHRSKDGLVI